MQLQTLESLIQLAPVAPLFIGAEASRKYWKIFCIAGLTSILDTFSLTFEIGDSVSPPVRQGNKQLLAEESQTGNKQTLAVIAINI